MKNIEVVFAFRDGRQSSSLFTTGRNSWGTCIAEKTEKGMSCTTTAKAQERIRTYACLPIDKDLPRGTDSLSC